jgi:hypothetical protein
VINSGVTISSTPCYEGYITNSLLIAEFSIDNIEDIQWSSEPFECLVIPDAQKEVIMALVEARSGCADRESNFTFDDFVEGKGRGLNVLLQYDS